MFFHADSLPMLASPSVRVISRALMLGLVCWLMIMPPSDALARKYAALVMDASTGEVLHSRRANDLRHPASITKVMTIYMLFEAIEQGKFTMNSKLKVSRKATQAPPSRIGLARGSTISVKDAIGTLITKSANDVAVVVAEALGGSEAKFAEMMTKKARKLGMKRTTFRNASGLHHRKQTTTAKDIAKLAQRVRQDFPQYYYLFKMRSYTYKGRKYRSHNKLLGRYPGMEGMKTGFINASGFNLLAVAKRNNQRVITVVFGGRTGNSRDRQVRKLMDLGFSRLPNMTVMKAPRRGEAPAAQIAVKQAPVRMATSSPSIAITPESPANKQTLSFTRLDDTKPVEKPVVKAAKKAPIKLNFTVIE